eukprot:g488.t1
MSGIQYSTRVLAQQRLSSVTVGDLVAHFRARGDPTARLAYAKVLHREVPLRLARRVVGLAEGVPESVSHHPSFRALVDGHQQLVSTLTSFPYPRTPMEGSEFTSLHRNLRRVYGQSFRYLHQSLEGSDVLEDQVVDTERAVDAFFASRISVRLMVDQLHLLNAPPSLPGNESSDLGVFDEKINVDDIIKSVCGNVRLPPELGVKGISVKSGDISNIFHVPGHVKSIVSSMLRNTVYEVGKARAAAHAVGRGGDLPAPADVSVQCLKIDEGRVLVQMDDNSGLLGKQETQGLQTDLGGDLFRYINRAQDGGPLGAEADSLDDPILQASSRRLNSGKLTSHSANDGFGLKQIGLPEGWTMTALGPRMLATAGKQEGGGVEGVRRQVKNAFLSNTETMGLPVARCLARHFRGDVMLGGDAGSTMMMRLDNIDRSFAL